MVSIRNYQKFDFEFKNISFIPKFEIKIGFPMLIIEYVTLLIFFTKRKLPLEIFLT